MTFSLQGILDHYGLTKRPFTLVPDPNFLYLTSQHSNAQAVLDYGIMSCAPITMVVGEIGTGKTTVVCEFLGRSPEDLTIGLVANAAPADRAEMLRLVLIALGEAVDETKGYSSLYAQLETFLVEQYRLERRVVLIFDEAQNLDRDSLEHLRMLTNINFGEHELVQLVLVGQPELEDMIRRPDLKQMAQRVSAQVFLSNLKQDEIEDYIKFRLEVAGVTRELFEPDTFEMIFKHTGGVPRIVNQFCDYALLYGFSVNAEMISTDILSKVIEDRLVISLDTGGENTRMGLGAPSVTKFVPVRDGDAL